MSPYDKIALYLKEGQSEYRSQEAQNHEFSIKAIGCSTFAVTIFGLSKYLINSNNNQLIEATLNLMVANLIVIVFFAMPILIPKNWKRPYGLRDVRESMEDHEVADIALGLGIGYEKAISSNWKILDPKARKLKVLVILTFLQVILFASLLRIG